MNIWKKRSESKEIVQAIENRLRDEKLNAAILNSYNMNKKGIIKPFDVNYIAENSNWDIKKETSDDREVVNMLQLIEHTELSTRKFMLNPLEGIKIGSDMNRNDIVISNREVSERQCEIFSSNGKIYVRDCGSRIKTIVQRKRKQAIVDEQGICIMTGDRILFGSVYYEVTVL